MKFGSIFDLINSLTAFETACLFDGTIRQNLLSKNTSLPPRLLDEMTGSPANSLLRNKRPPYNLKSNLLY